MSRRRDATRLAITGLVVAALVAGPTYALWGRDSEGVGGLVRHGDLGVELVGAAAWQETSPDVAAPRAGEVLDDGTVDHLATPGDSLSLTQEFRPRLVGDNLAARLTVSWDDGFSAPAGVEATYVVVDPDGAATDPAPLGSAVVVPSPADSLTPAEVAAWGDAPWRIVVTASLTGDVPLAEPDASGEVPGVREADAASLGGIRIELAQVRDGKGFTS